MDNALTRWIASQFTNNTPQHIAVETIDGVMHSRVVSCDEHNSTLAVANARIEILETQAKADDDKLAELHDLMDNALPIVFNCGTAFAEILKLDPNTVVPGLAPDGKSAQVTVDKLTLNAYPFASQIVCTIKGSTEDATVFPVVKGTIAVGYQDQIRGMHERSKADDVTPRILTSLVL